MDSSDESELRPDPPSLQPNSQLLDVISEADSSDENQKSQVNSTKKSEKNIPVKAKKARNPDSQVKNIDQTSREEKDEDKDPGLEQVKKRTDDLLKEFEAMGIIPKK